MDTDHLPPSNNPRSAALSRSASVIVSSRSRRASVGARAAEEQSGARGRTSRPRPITFALPPSSPSAEHKHFHPHSHSQLATSTSSSFLNRLSRKLSQSRTTLVRRVSKSGRVSPTAARQDAALVEREKENDPDGASSSSATPTRPTRPSRPRTTSKTPSSLSVLAARVEELQMPLASTSHGGAGGSQAPFPSTPAKQGAPLKRAGLELALGKPSMRRTKSEAKRRNRIPNEEERMEELVRRTETAAVVAEQKQPGGTREEEGQGMRVGGKAKEDWTEVHSELGSYYWSEALGVCWDGREKVHPDFLFSFQPYSSNSDVLPSAQHPSPAPLPSPAQLQASRVVYASTLSSFPPRPPLRPRTPELTPASRIIAEYRALHGTLTPSVRGGDGAEEETEDEEEQDTPRPGERGGNAATPVAQDESPSVAFFPTASTSTVRPSSIPLFPSAVANNPFTDASASPRLFRPPTVSTHDDGASSAYSTPASEAAGFAFSDGGRRESSEGGAEEREEQGRSGLTETEGESGNGGVSVGMSSGGSKTSLESYEAAARAGEGVTEGRESEEDKRGRKVSGMTRITAATSRTTMTEGEGEEVWRECE